ncbi:MAG: hypothetical protein WC755_06370 [Candidatus Woesearchaeota archaeon]|jgi:hypothetical protein
MTETTIFRLTLGDSPVIRVLEFLIEGRGLDYSLTDIAENSNVGWTTLHRIWNNLEKTKMVVPTRIIGKAKLYKLNEKNPAVQQLIKLFDTLIYLQTEKFFEKQTIVAESSVKYGKRKR